jgi:hypothetical protein
MPNPWVSLRHDKLIPVNKVVNKKEQLEEGLEKEEKKNLLLQTASLPIMCMYRQTYICVIVCLCRSKDISPSSLSFQR